MIGMLRDVTVEVRWQLVRHRRALVGWAVALTAVVAVYVPFYPTLGGVELQSLIDALPADLVAAMGYDRIGSPAGYLTSTVFGLLGPALLLVFGIGRGARTVAGEEEVGRLELAASAPVRRDVLLAGRIIALHTQILLLAAVTFAATTALVTVIGLDVAVSGILAAALGLNLLTNALATVALAAGAVTGRRGVAVAVGGGTAVAAFIAHALVDIVAWGDVLASISPFSWYLAADPVATGIELSWSGLRGPVLLGTSSLVAWAVASVRFARRDLGV